MVHRGLSPEQRVLLEGSLPWIYELVRRHINAFPGPDMRPSSASGRRADLIQAASLGAAQVMPKYDKSKGTVTTFITRPVLYAIREEDFRRLRGPVDLPRLGDGGRNGYASPSGLGEPGEYETHTSLILDDILDATGLFSRVHREVPPLMRGLSPENSVRALESLLSRIFEGRSNAEDALQMGLSKTRVGQLRKVAQDALEEWARSLRQEGQSES